MPDKPYAAKSPLLESDYDASKGRPPYTDDEMKYLSRLQTRLEIARDQREMMHPEFDGMTFSEWWDMNEKAANTYIEPKRNPEDTPFQSGTIRQKLLALLAVLNNLDMQPDVSAFDENAFEVQGMGQAIEDVMYKSSQMDEDDEKKMLRQYELLKQGSVFVEEVWDEKFIKDKKFVGSKSFDGKIEGLTWTDKLKRYFARPSRNVVNSLMVYLGNIRLYGNIGLQPYIYTVDVRSYQETEAIYGQWERWPYVSKQLNPIFQERNRSIYDNNWRLLRIDPGWCEIIKYQDKWNNEFALMINGVLMTPVGLPFPWGYNEYNLEQQNLEPIHTHFAYGNSLCHKMRTKVGILDAMMRMAVLKTQKSYAPPTLNLSGRVLSRSIFAPAKILTGIPDGSVKPLMPSDLQGVQPSEFQMIKELMESIDADSVSPSFQGQKGEGDQTATQVLQMQQQANQMLGLTMFACQLLEWKIAWLRLYNILLNWFDPIDAVVDTARNAIVNKYKTISREVPIDGEGMGVRMIIPSKEPINPGEVYDMEEQNKKRTGRPTRILFVDPDEVRAAKYEWQISIIPHEKRTSPLARMMFRAEMADAQFFLQDLNLQYLEEKFANVWNEDVNRMFNRQQNSAMPPAQPGQPLPPGKSPQPVGGKGNAPTPPQAGAGLSNVMSQAMQQ